MPVLHLLPVRSSCNQHVDYSASAMCYLCVSMPLTMRPSSFQRWIWRSNFLSACCAHKGTEESAESLTWKNWKTVLYPVASMPIFWFPPITPTRDNLAWRLNWMKGENTSLSNCDSHPSKSSVVLSRYLVDFHCHLRVFASKTHTNCTEQLDQMKNYW